MAAASKKRGTVESQMGRPYKGALSEYPQKLRNAIKTLRGENPGWGAISILVELEEEGYFKPDLPCADSVHRFLKEEGFILRHEPIEKLPVNVCKKPKEVHEIWEMDAKGAMEVSGIGHQSLIDIKDSHSKKYCMTFPVSVTNYNTQPSLIHYQWALRLAFIESGLPKVVQVDKDSVFIENSGKSPFPSRFHLWLLALDIELCFIDRPPPAQNNIIERSHRTMNNQAIKGKYYESWGAFFKNCNTRRKRLNEKYPSRSLDKQAPLQAFPQSIHSGRPYAIEQEQGQLLSLERIYTFLAQGKWHRKVSSTKGIALGGKRYHIKNATPKSMVNITFCKQTEQLVFRDVNELVLVSLPIKGISKGELIGGDTKSLLSMKKQLFKSRDFPLKNNNID